MNSMTRIQITYLAAAALLGCLWGTSARANDVAEPVFNSNEVRKAFMAGFNGNETELARGLGMCKAALEKDPNNAEAMVWHGAGTYYRSGQAFMKADHQTGHALFQKGLGEMDKAVSLAPENLTVRLTRGTALVNSVRQMGDDPELDGLLGNVILDYEKVMEVGGEELAFLPTDYRGEVLLGLAEAYERTGDQKRARATMERIAREMPDTGHGKAAGQWLSKLSNASAAGNR